MVAILSCKQNLCKFIFCKDFAIKIQFFNSSYCSVFPTREDQRNPSSLAKNLLFHPSITRKKNCNKLPPPKFYYSHWIIIFMCNPIETSCLAIVICSFVIFVLPSYCVLILIDIQFLQNVVFSFEMGSNGQNQSPSGSHLWIKKSSPHWDGQGNPPYPLVLFGKSCIWKQLWPQKFVPRCQID